MNEKEKLLVCIDYFRCLADDLNMDECRQVSKMIDNVIDKARSFRASEDSKGCNIIREGKVVSVPL